MVVNQVASGNRASVNLSNQPKGMYLLMVDDAKVKLVVV